MQDYIKRLLIAGLMALCISLLFLGGKHSQAEMLDIPELTSDWVWPAEGVITDLYGTRHGHHKGIDIAGGFKTPIHSVDKGIVTKSYYSGSYGHVVFIKHDNNLETVYAHLNKRNVEEGQAVKQGDIIGLMGNTGDSSGVHLHFEIHKEKWTYEKENAVDPVLALGDTSVGEPVEAMAKVEEVTMETVARLRLADDIAINDDQHGSSKAESKDKNQHKSAKASPQQPEIKHTVKAGETLWSIAKMYHTSVDSIKHSNQLDSDQISRGVVLAIGKSADNRYVVVSGDTLISIARKTNTTVSQLKALNNLTTDTIQPQQILNTR
ncbi:peptidoglycan DD-metalloendopeptidase family protein [Bacillus sp. ISL-35]|uniref:M23 family metallopeptidase n=1 Tax=Bacillus sp. ISL-35 TaxID=2819122 RepID=UPI001BE59E32|nr:M23 family metallopeptidase [Bacillus sp. ISL-35]MBT2677668.1 peptidoglycan DD-metalloendopeptidase family protein [Bacillus sp. ISL-35]MBT2704618.1 peptidoglycan DD-metalloendopeptidase family protein [Chryseobacterium sp. ISL-80]